MSKTKTIKLKFLRSVPTRSGREDSWEVVTITNSTRYKPNEILTGLQVDDLCKASGWTVNMVGAP